MDEIGALLHAYQRFVAGPWDRKLSGAERVWFALYQPRHERKLRFRVPDFDVVTRAAGHSWLEVDLTPAFARWMAGQEYRESYFEAPDDLVLTLEEDFEAYAVDLIAQALVTADEDTVVALVGVASLFGLASVSKVVTRTADRVPGRLLVFFPGEHDGPNYRLLNARDGWNYLAIPISA